MPDPSERDGALPLFARSPEAGLCANCGRPSDDSIHTSNRVLDADCTFLEGEVPVSG